MSTRLPDGEEKERRNRRGWRVGGDEMAFLFVCRSFFASLVGLGWYVFATSVFVFLHFFSFLHEGSRYGCDVWTTDWREPNKRHCVVVACVHFASGDGWRGMYQGMTGALGPETENWIHGGRRRTAGRNSTTSIVFLFFYLFLVYASASSAFAYLRLCRYYLPFFNSTYDVDEHSVLFLPSSFSVSRSLFIPLARPLEPLACLKGGDGMAMQGLPSLPADIVCPLQVSIFGGHFFLRYTRQDGCPGTFPKDLTVKKQNSD